LTLVLLEDSVVGLRKELVNAGLDTGSGLRVRPYRFLAPALAMPFLVALQPQVRGPGSRRR
jgi:hypothetical protein